MSASHRYQNSICILIAGISSVSWWQWRCRKDGAGRFCWLRCCFAQSYLVLVVIGRDKDLEIFAIFRQRSEDLCHLRVDILPKMKVRGGWLERVELSQISKVGKPKHEV